MEFDWVMGCGLGWFMGSEFLLCDGSDWARVGLTKLEPRTTLYYWSKGMRSLLRNLHVPLFILLS